jgi:hypothetical protein
MTIKGKLRKLAPKGVLARYRALVRALDDRRNMGQPPASIFAKIYEKHQWGGDKSSFSSGTGSVTEEITGPYVRAITAYLRAFGPGRPAVVDLGCGDFRVGRNFLPYCSTYIAADIVPAVIEKHKAAGFGENVRFMCLNMIEDELPPGDICFLRQVLQHLSNEQIQKILPKLARYGTVFVTEHYPTENPKIVPNVDKVCGAGIRLYKNSGVYLDRPPFNIPPLALQLLLEVPGHQSSVGEDEGVIRTYKFEPASIARRADA